MATILVRPGAIPVSAAATRVETATWPLYAVMLSSACIVTGLIWDISWHRTVGRDTFWTYPHLLEQFAAALAGLSCGWLVLRTTFAGTPAERGATVGFWGFRGPLGAWVCIWGTILMIASAPFDDWWHNAYGLDVKIVSPPHMVLALGMVSIEIGAMLMVLAAQNRAPEAAARRYGLIYAAAGGILVTMMCTLIMEYAGMPNQMHGSMFYKVTGAVLPIFLVAFARASRLRWPATATAAVYMAIVIVMIWALEIVPATPKLAPIYNPVTHMVPPFFPLLLVVPAFLIDLVLHRAGRRHDWMLAVGLGVAFVVVMLAVHWFWAEFMLSPAARNPVLAADHWDYNRTLGPWRYQYWHLDGQANTFALAPFMRGLGFATLLAIASARIGLWWGNGMARVER